MTTTIHHWWKGNIYSIVTVQGDLAHGDSHPSYTTVYIIDGGHRLYRVVWSAVEMCSMDQRAVTGWLSWRNWASQMRMVHLYRLDTTKQWWLSWRSRETHVYYQCRESKASHTRYAETWSWVVHWEQLVRGCGYWFWHYFDSITQRQAWSTCLWKLQDQRIVYLGTSL